MPRKRRDEVGGRYLVDEKSASSLGAAIAYAATLAAKERRTVEVRIIGNTVPVRRAVYHTDDRVVTIEGAHHV